MVGPAELPELLPGCLPVQPPAQLKAELPDLLLARPPAQLKTVLPGRRPDDKSILLAKGRACSDILLRESS